jgi:hypothetical protein
MESFVATLKKEEADRFPSYAWTLRSAPQNPSLRPLRGRCQRIG